jgi:hypothetical protein
MKGQPAYEFVFALIAVALITAGYVFLAQDVIPRPNSAIGYTLGTVGFLMMLSTETLYSLRKRVVGFHHGRMSIWLQVHVFTGLVGPYLVLLHSGWRFQGLAGILTLVVAVVVVSGLIGRYIYTAVPRSLDGVEIAVVLLEERIAVIDQQLQEQGIADLGTAMLTAIETPAQGWGLVLGRPWIRWRQNRQLARQIDRLDAEGQAKAVELKRLLMERLNLQRQMRSLDVTRRLLALWHVFHIPLSASLFALALIHIGAALYYATFMQ